MDNDSILSCHCAVVQRHFGSPILNDITIIISHWINIPCQVVATTNWPRASRYACRFALQDFGQETIQGLVGPGEDDMGMVG